jgi:hypothetical protein
VRTHQEIDQRALAMHRLVVEKIRQNPALFDHAKRTLARWRGSVCARSQPYLEEWECLMNQGLDACLAAAVEESAHATALRQSSPFAGLLTHQDRFTFLKTWRLAHAAS